MSDYVVRVEDLSKAYVLRHKAPGHGRYLTLRDKIEGGVKRIFGGGAGGARATEEQFWALRDISFEVGQGERIGVIGRNGAGKSTLLKILSFITEPTKGCVRIRGRLASLLEVGTGFHPELTGRENIYLNGAILGMARAEIRARFDEIVAFAEVEKFLDTPVKRYSSGMYVRLAFAVAAHLDPEILVVDEVLAVGDAAFQKKCLGKMTEVSQGGRTIFFVSHNLGAVTHLCQRGIILDRSQLKFDGPVSEAVHRYNLDIMAGSSAMGEQAQHLIFKETEPSHRAYDIVEVGLYDLEGKPKPVIATGDSFAVRITFRAKFAVSRASASIRFTTSDGVRILFNDMDPDSGVPLSIEPGVHTVECVYRDFPLAAGDFLFGAGLTIPYEEHLFRMADLGRITVVPGDAYKSGYTLHTERSTIVASHSWKILD